MSYEGRIEVICLNSHYYCYPEPYGGGAYQDCPFCKAAPKLARDIDDTNGLDEDDPSTYQAGKREVGFDDQWLKDHYGNEYAVKHPKYEPDKPSLWTVVKR